MHAQSPKVIRMVQFVQRVQRSFCLLAISASYFNKMWAYNLHNFEKILKIKIAITIQTK